MRLVVGLVVALIASSAFAQYTPTGPVFPVGSSSNFLHYYAITTAASQQGSSDSSNFPVCVNTGSSGGCSPLSISSNLNTYVQNTVTQSGGLAITIPADAVFGTTSSCATLLPWEWESYSSGAGIAWVQLPTLHHSTQDTFYLCFDKASTTTQQNTGSYAPSAVWDSYTQEVLHLGGGTLSLVDSTSNGHNGTQTTGTNATVTTGEIDGGAAFGGSSGVTTYTWPTVSAVTVSFWVNFSVVTGYIYPLNTQYESGSRLSVLEYNDSHIDPYINTDSDACGLHTGTATLSASTWYHVVEVYTGTTLLSYVNGSQDLSSSCTGTITGTAAVILGYVSYPLTGSMDEYKFANTARSADWVTAEYNNQKPSSTFLTAGTLH